MTGVVGALVALAVVVALVLVLGVRPHVRRLTRSVAALRADTAARLARLRAIARRGSTSTLTPAGPPFAAVRTSPIGGHGPPPRMEARP